jgi:pimeloyl-ACP methyl ester carboxylesterase
MNARERMLQDLPLSERVVSAARVATTVLEGGEGPPLLLLHGGIECGGAVWAPLIPRLAGAHRLIVPDLPGLGESEPVARLDPPTFRAWLRDLLRQTCDEPPVLIAHSLGGGPAARFAARDGELLRRLVIYGSPGMGPYRIPLGLKVIAIRFSLRPTERNDERMGRYALHDFDGVRDRDPGWFAAFTSYNLERARVPHVKRTMRGLIGSATKQVPDADLRRIGIPVELAWGRHDRFVPLSHATAASSRLGWPLEVIEDSGHAPHIERPDAFAAAALGTALRPA